MKNLKYINPLFGDVHSEFTWCGQCECVYKTESWVKNEWHCPGMNCNGSPTDAFPFDKVKLPKAVALTLKDEEIKEGDWYPNACGWGGHDR